MESRHPDIGIGVRPRGPLVYRVAERLSLISDALYLEGAEARRKGGGHAEGRIRPPAWRPPTRPVLSRAGSAPDRHMR